MAKTTVRKTGGFLVGFISDVIYQCLLLYLISHALLLYMCVSPLGTVTITKANGKNMM